MPRLLTLACLGLFVFTTIPAAADADEARFQAGAATSNITPFLGGAIVGGFAPIPSGEIHDELHARCLVLDDGQNRVALVVCDLLGIHDNVSREARRLIEESLSIPPANVLISATHTHSATSTLSGPKEGATSKLDEYQTFVARRIADGVRRAANHLAPAELGFGTVDVPEHVFNRRWTMRPGTMPPNPFGTIDLVKMNPPAGSPNLEEPAGPTDPTVSVIGVRAVDGPWIAVWATYSLHYVGGVGPNHISADYFAMFSDRLKELAIVDGANSSFVAAMANGTSGDINNISFRTPRPGKPAYEQMRYVAYDVADKVHALLPSLKCRRDIRLHARYREPILQRRPVTPEQLAWAERTLAKPVEDPKKTDLSRIYAERTKNLAATPETVAVPLQILSLGPVTIGTMPCEVFCEIGLEFREKCPLQPAFLVSLAHGYMGYLPTPRHHDLGGYETWIGTNRLEREASVKMLAELLDMAQDIADASAASSTGASTGSPSPK